MRSGYFKKSKLEKKIDSIKQMWKDDPGFTVFISIMTSGVIALVLPLIWSLFMRPSYMDQVQEVKEVPTICFQNFDEK